LLGSRPDRPTTNLAGRFRTAVGQQLQRPTGAGGAILGRLMAILNARPYRLTIDALDVRPDDSVLDIGFGPGWGFRLIHQRAPIGRVCGIDHSQAMLLSATRRNTAAIAAGRLELVQGTFNALPWADGTFDKILLVNAVYFFDRGGRDIAEVFRVLRSGGRIAIYATERSTMERWPFSGPDTHCTFDAADLGALFEAGGFDRSQIDINAVALPLGVRGLVAVAGKCSATTG
jgi:SAM-dependent methyltransferase